MFSVDEFWFAHRIYQYKDALPYRDFAPYKTVLGYYLLLPSMLLSNHPLPTLILTKEMITILNTLILFGSAYWLRRLFSPTGVLASLAILISSEVMLFYSTNIRVDLLGYWFCFFSFLFLLEERFLLAGLLMGFGLITTQKSIWCLFASTMALACYWLCITRHLKTIWHLLQFHAIAWLILILYILGWSLVADIHTVIHSVFYEASAMYHLNWYDFLRQPFWNDLILSNPLLFLLWPLPIISLFVSSDKDPHQARRLLVTTYALTILCCLIPYKQVFPYYMQIAIPTLLLLYTAFFSWFFALLHSSPRLISIQNRPFSPFMSKVSVWAILLSYIITFIYLTHLFILPSIYRLLCCIPIMIGLYATSKQDQSMARSCRSITLATLMIIGGFYPSILLLHKLSKIEGSYQKSMLQTMSTLLQDHSHYVAGIELFYNKTQPITGMRHLMGPAIDYLEHPTENIRRVMTPSLYEDPTATTDSVITAWKKTGVKFYVNNYRMAALPAKIKHYLATEYNHYWGSIYLYAPSIPPGRHALTLKFSSSYYIDSPQSDHIILNGTAYHTHTTIYLRKGRYFSQAATRYRLKLIPQIKLTSLNSAFSQDQPEKMLII